MPLSEPNVERYLEEHPGYLQKYVVTHLSETDLKELYEHWYKVSRVTVAIVTMVTTIAIVTMVTTIAIVQI